MNRGDVVLALIPYIEGVEGKRRPVVIEKANRFNQTGLDPIVAAISTNLSKVHQPNQLWIDPTHGTGVGAAPTFSGAVRSLVHDRSTQRRPDDRPPVRILNGSDR
jgi:hypothetical protein